MPIEVATKIQLLSQESFSKIAYGVVNEAYVVYRDLGAFFDEKVYQHALAARVSTMLTEVRIDVSSGRFSKAYYMDALVEGGALFEFKAADSISQAHKSQLLNYLLLCGLQHGKILNFRGPQLGQHFVNTSLTQADRKAFKVVDSDWSPSGPFDTSKKQQILEAIHDWGTGLDLALYSEFIIDLFGGPDKVFCDVDVVPQGVWISRQTFPLCASGTLLYVTTHSLSLSRHQESLQRLLSATSLKKVQWINITHRTITFKTLYR